MVWSKKFQTALYAIDGVGPATFNAILNALTKHEVTEQEFWVNKAQIWQEISLDKKIVESIKKFKKEHNINSYYEQLLSKDVRVVLKSDLEFPGLLNQLDRSPPLLFARGAQLTGRESFLGVVGTRNITEYGRRVITEFIPSLIQFGKTITSGFMYGVDAVAQRTALQANGKTVGILGFGFDFMYPPEHQALFTYFLNQGATFLSPFAPHISAKPGNFPARNAIVAGMSEGVLVQITAITHRKNPIITLSTLGVPPDDSSIAASLTAAIAMKRGLKRHGVPVREVYVPPEGVTHLIVVSVERGGSRVARQVLDYFTARRVMVSKVIVVDKDLDPFDMNQVIHAFATKCHPAKGITVEHYEGRANALTPCFSADERRRLKGASVVFDATWPDDWEQEGIPVKSAFETTYPEAVKKRSWPSGQVMGWEENYEERVSDFCASAGRSRRREASALYKRLDSRSAKV